MAENKINNKDFFILIKKNRLKYNEIFLETKKYYPKILKSDLEFYFQFFLLTYYEKNTDETKIEILYKKTLELIGKNIIGTNSKFPAFDFFFLKFLLFEFNFSFLDFDKFLNIISNFLLNFSSEIEKLEKIISDLEIYLKDLINEKEFYILVKILIWKNGFSFYREFSIVNFQNLNQILQNKLFGKFSIDKINELKKSPWFSLENSIPKNELIKSEKSFMMNGNFKNIPILKIINNQIFVSDLVSTYLVFADYYSISFQRINSKEILIEFQNYNPFISLEEISQTKISFINKISLNIKSFIKTNHSYFFSLKDSYSVFIYPII